jgi:CheY-like chemotaxis protein
MGRLLVIDDSDDFRETVSDLLRDAGYEVLTVGSPEEGRLELAAGGFDLVLCDLVMPVNPGVNGVANDEDGMFDGESAMVGVHAIGQFSREFPQVPVIAVSGKLVGEPLKILDQFGAFSTLSKPFSRKQLLEAVDAAISRDKPAVN